MCESLSFSCVDRVRDENSLASASCVGCWKGAAAAGPLGGALQRSPASGEHYSSSAIVVNVWRAPGNPTKLLTEWKKQHGQQAALRACSKLPPRPLRGRWAAID
eukprot:6758880-Alexandrium_andersonii.AAC.1